MKNMLCNLYREADPAGRESLRKKAEGDADLLKAFDEVDGAHDEPDGDEDGGEGDGDEDDTKKGFAGDELAAFLKSFETVADPSVEADPAQVDLFAGTETPEDLDGVDPNAGAPMDAAPILKSINDHLVDVLGKSAAIEDTSAWLRKGSVAVAKRLDAMSKSMGDVLAAAKAETEAARNETVAVKAEVAAAKAETEALRKSVDALDGLIRAQFRLPVAPRGVTTTAAQVIPGNGDVAPHADRPADQWERYQKSMNLAVREGDDARKAQLLPYRNDAANRALTVADCTKLGI